MSESPPIRIKVLLNHFYNDHRQKAIVTIDKSWTIVKHLQSHIQSMFQIKKLYLATADGFWFPSNECISVIFASDTVVAHPKQSSKRSTETALLNESNNTEVTHQKNIYFTNMNTFSTKKNDRPITTSTPIEVSSAPANDSMEHDGKKKRKRVRKRKLKNKANEDEQQKMPSPSKHSKWINDLEKFDIPEKSKLKEKREKFKEKIVPQPIKPKTHIWFSEEGKRHVGQTDEQQEESGFQSNQKSNDNDEPYVLPAEARIIQAIYTEIDLNTDNQPSSVTEDISTTNLTTKQTMPTEIDNKTVDEPAKENISMDNTKTVENDKETAMEKMRKNIDTMALPALVDAPKLNDVIAFKTLKLTETYEPIVSEEYIIGMVQKIDGDVITLFIMAGANQLKDPHGKFELTSETETDDLDNNIQEVEFRRNELLEPKICQLC